MSAPAPISEATAAIPTEHHVDPSSQANSKASTDDVRLQVTHYHPTIHKGSNVDFTSLIHLEAPALPETAKEDDRKALQISAVLDVSGSMSGEKLKLAKEALAFLISELGPKDKFGLVSFASDIVEEQRPTVMSATGKETLEKTVAGLSTRGCTNLSGGLLTGIAQASGDGSSATPIPHDTESRRSFQHHGKMKQMKQQQTNASPGLFSRIKSAFAPAPTVPTNVVEASSSSQQQTKQPTTSSTDDQDIVTLTFAQPAATPAAAPASPPKTSHDRQRRVVLLFTDGQANEGITGLDQLTTATKQCLAQQPHDVTVFTFGFGADHDATLLRQLAECSEGSYYYIQSARDMKEIFADCLGGLLSVVAEQIQIQVKPLTTPGAPCRVAKVATHFPMEQAPDGTFTVRVKDLYAEEKRDILITIAVDTSKCEVGQKLPLGRVELTYQNPNTQGTGSVKKEALIETTVAAGGKYSGPVDERVDEQLARYQAVEAMKAAQKCADEGDFGGARLALEQQLAGNANMRCASTAFGKGITEELTNAMKDASDSAHYREVGQKRMAMKQSAHAQQRSNAIDVTENACAMYTTSAKCAMKKKSAAFSFSR